MKAEKAALTDKRFYAQPQKEENKALRTQTQAEVPAIMDEILNLCKTPSPTGCVHQAQALVVEKLKGMGLEPFLSHKGTVFCELKKTGTPADWESDPKALLLSAHIDTLGLIVRSIKGNGRLMLTLDGGYPFQYVEQENATLFTREGRTYEGTIRLTNPAVHASREVGTMERNDKTMEMVLDEPVKNREDVEKLGIRQGDFIFLETRSRLSGSGFLKSRHLDDKASAGMLLHLAQEVAEGKIELKRKTYLAFTTYEEVGHGASAGHPEDVVDMLAVDMGVVGDDLDTDEYCLSICAKDSSGPYDYDFTTALIHLAEDKELKFAVDIYPFYGSDAAAALHAGRDYRTALVGTGVAASHGYERIHEEGVANTYSLLKSLVGLTFEDFELLWQKQAQ